MSNTCENRLFAMMGRKPLSTPAVADVSFRKKPLLTKWCLKHPAQAFSQEKLEKSEKTILKNTYRCNCKKLAKFCGIKTRTALRKPQRRTEVS